MNPLWPLAKHYIAGETVDEVIKIAQGLKRSGLNTTIDILGESIRTRLQVEKVLAEYKELLDLIKLTACS